MAYLSVLCEHPGLIRFPATSASLLQSAVQKEVCTILDIGRCCGCHVRAYGGSILLLQLKAEPVHWAFASIPERLDTLVHQSEIESLVRVLRHMLRLSRLHVDT